MDGPGTIFRFSVDPALHGELVTGTLVVTLRGEPVTLELTIPAGPTTTEALLPVLHGLSSLFAERGAAHEALAGKAVSCRAGCGACCRQLVPLPAAEARHIAGLVAAMPEPRRGATLERFAAALEALNAAGVLPQLADAASAGGREIALAYYAAGVACPFLEDEACSIHPDRPLACREYLVTSPAERCMDLSAPRIDRVSLEWRLLRALVRAEPDQGWVPLVMALRHAAGTPPPLRPGPAILGAVVATIGS